MTSAVRKQQIIVFVVRLLYADLLFVKKMQKPDKI